MSVTPLETLLAADKLVSGERVRDLIEMIWSNDRFFTFPAFQKTAASVRDTLQEASVESRIYDLPADGKTVLGDWKMPLGWDCSGATLEMLEPAAMSGRVIADYRKLPCHVVMWSGPTPPGGSVGELVAIENGGDLRRRKADVRGKFVLTGSRELKRALFDCGALGVVIDLARNQHVLDDCAWINGWSDHPDGWAFHTGDAPLPGMVVSPNAGRELRALLAQGSVRLKMAVESRYFETTMPIVSGLVPGESEDEILAIGHLMEQGANDNASGTALIAESLRVLQSATRSGRLAPLRRSVRGLFVNECYGTIGFAARHPEIVRRMRFGVNWDTAGRHQEVSGARFKHHCCPDAAASVADTLMDELLKTWIRRHIPFINLKDYQTYSLTDNAYCDPAIGVHCTYIDSQDYFWHTSADTMKHICAHTLKAFTTVSVAYLHYLATARAAEALWLAERTLGRYGRELSSAETWGANYLRNGAVAMDAGAKLARAQDYVSYIELVGCAAIDSARRLMDAGELKAGLAELRGMQAHLRKSAKLHKDRLRQLAGCRPGRLPAPAGIEGIAGLKPRKTFIGTPSYEGIPWEERSVGMPTWGAMLHCVLFWADGTLTVEEILRRVFWEYSESDAANTARHLRFMEKHGLIEWVNGKPARKSAVKQKLRNAKRKPSASVKP